MADHLRDEELLQRISNGDRTAMKVVYDRYSDPVCRFAMGWLADQFEASDVMHDTMMEVWRFAGRFSGRSSPKTWIFSIAKNKAIDKNRKSGRTINQEADPEVFDEALSPEAMTDAFQDAKRVRACIEKLSPNHRSVIHLAFFDDLTYPEIAALEGAPVGTIKTRIMHAKKLLMRCLSD